MSTQDVKYYNLTLGTIDKGNSGEIYKTQSNQAPQQAFISTNQTEPILTNPQDYYCSIIRFSVPCRNLPLLQFLIQTPVSNINLSVYSFTLTWTTFSSGQTFVIYDPENFTAPVPPTGTPTQTFSDYYFIYDYEHLIDIFNECLATATANLNTASGQSFTAPFFVFDATTQLITLYSNDAQFNKTLANPVKIFFNNAMNTFLEGFHLHIYDFGSANGQDGEFRITNYNDINTTTIAGIKYIKTTQNFVSLAYGNLLKNILIATDMDIKSEGTYINTPTAIQNTNYKNIMTDFLPDVSSTQQAGIASNIFIYNASSLYRIFEFNTKTPIYSLSVRLFYSDNLGNIYPLYLDKGTSCDLKFMFIKKDLIKKNFLSLTN